MKFQKFTLLFACLLSVWSLKAQELEDYKTWSAGAGLGFTKSYTDILQFPIGPTLQNRPDIQYSINAHIRKSFSNVFSVQFNAGFDRVQGTLRINSREKGDWVLRAQKLNRWGLNTGMIWFHTSVLRGGFDVQLNLSNIDLQYRENADRKFLLYLYAGNNLALYNPDIRYNNGRDVQPVSYNNGRVKVNQNANWAFIGRGGVGARYKLNSKFDIGAEVGINYAFTDLLDGSHIEGTMGDMYVNSQLSINYKLPSKTAGVEAEHIDWANPGKEILADMKEMQQQIDSVANIVESSVANADSDGDGVIDSEDKQPYTPFGAEVDSEGRAKDSDGDGVYDGLDQQPNTPAGRLVNFQGKEIVMKEGTTEGPGTIVPGVPGAASGGEVAAYFPSIFFDSAKKSIRSNDIDKLVRVATLMAQNTKLKIKLIGHADIRGGTEFNEKLAQQRAEAARDYLVNNLGADSSRIIVESKGESTPLSPTLNNVNRRVDIIGM